MQAKKDGGAGPTGDEGMGAGKNASKGAGAGAAGENAGKHPGKEAATVGRDAGKDADPVLATGDAVLATPQERLPVTAAELRATAVLLGFFLVTMAIAILLAGPSLSAGLQQFGGDTDNPLNVLWYIGLILAFTLLILWVAKRGWKWIIRWLILLAVGSSIIFVVYPILYSTVGMADEASLLIGIAAAIVVTVALWKHPEWYVIDTAGLLVAAGAASVFGISFVPWLVVLLLALLAIYDAIAVYRTKHMLSLADTVIELRLPVLLVIPKHGGYRFREDAARMKKATKTNKGEREAMFMGLGDLVMPTILVVAAFVFIPVEGADLEARVGDPYRTGDVPVSLLAVPEWDEAAGALFVTYTLSSTDPNASNLAWSLDHDKDDDYDRSGTGLPATERIPYQSGLELPMTLYARAKVVDTPEREGEVERQVVIQEDMGGWYGSLARLAHHPAALGAALGTLVGYGVLMMFVLRGNPQAGLPLLNGGAILGFLVGLWVMTGSFVFWQKWYW